MGSFPLNGRVLGRGQDRTVNAHMKPSTLSFVLLALTGLTATVLAVDYGDLVNKGYRWVNVNGPYAYPAKEEAQKGGAKRNSESGQLDGHAYFLIPGMVVLVVETDSSSGLSRIRAGGIAADLWTATKNLSTQPVRDTLGVIETPDNASIISFTSPRPTPGSNASPAASPSR
jgi:hypothetical protein